MLHAAVLTWTADPSAWISPVKGGVGVGVGGVGVMVAGVAGVGGGGEGEEGDVEATARTSRGVSLVTSCFPQCNFVTISSHFLRVLVGQP